MKKILIALGGLVIILLVAAFALPIIFKDDIKSAIDTEIDKSVNADVVFDTDHFGLSLFTNFPNITASLEYFSVINKAPFEGDILFAVEKLEVEVNLKDILFGDGVRIKGITLNHPEVFIKVLEDGTANWDIYIAESDSLPIEAESEEDGEFSFGIDHWEINNGHVIYDDQSLPFYTEIKGLNHTGKGDFTQDIVDLDTYTKTDTLSITYDGVEYLSKKQVEIDMAMAMENDYSKYTFKENTVKVNELALGFDGVIELLEEDMPIDITFESKESSFKGLLSLVPGVFKEGFEDIKTEGVLAFNGFAKGTYSEESMPAFNINLDVADGMFQYPDLPSQVKNINLDMLVDNKDGIIENTSVHVRNFHMDFGNNPVDAKVLVENLRDYRMNADINASLNLAELNKMVPMEGLDMKGLFDLTLKANGVYDSVRNIIPSVEATMSLKNGYAKTSEFPIPMEDVHFTSTVVNASGKMADTKIQVNDMNMVMDGEQFNINLLLDDLDNYKWELDAKGGVDLEKITKIFPLEGMQLSGKINADIHTKGQMSDLDAERYDKLPTSGTLNVSNFNYKDSELPYEVKINNASASFDPKAMNLNSYSGTVGKSDMKASGSITNYIGYVFGENQVLKGNMAFQSNLLDLNEFMVEEESTTPDTSSDSTEMGVIPIPENIDFVLKSNVKQVEMMDWTLNNVTGDIIARDGVAKMTNVKFNMLGGAFGVNGSYNTKDIKHPKYDFKLDIVDLPIQNSYNAFVSVQKLAPIAQFMDGNLSTNFKVNGELDQNMMPDLSTLNGEGLLEIAKAAIKNTEKVKLLASLSKATKLKEKSTLVDIKDAVMSAKLENGKLTTEPFDINYAGYSAKVSGSSSLDGTMSYDWDMDVPAKDLGALSSQFNQLAGNDPNQPVPVKVKIGGSFLNPTVSLDLSESKGQATAAVKEELKEKTKGALDNVVKDDKVKDVVGNLLGGDKSEDANKDETTTNTNVDAKDDLKKKVEEEALDKVKNLFKKKKKN